MWADIGIFAYKAATETKHNLFIYLFLNGRAVIVNELIRTKYKI